MVRKTSYDRSCCFRHDQYVIVCQKYVLFPQRRSEIVLQLNQQTSGGEAGEDPASRSSGSDHGFDVIYCVYEEQRGVQDGTIRVNPLYPVVGKVK